MIVSHVHFPLCGQQILWQSFYTDASTAVEVGELRVNTESTDNRGLRRSHREQKNAAKRGECGDPKDHFSADTSSDPHQYMWWTFRLCICFSLLRVRGKARSSMQERARF